MEHEIELAYFYEDYALIDSLSMPDFDDIIEPIIKKAIAVAETALQKAEMDESNLNRILLAGGTSQFPLVKDLLAKKFGRPVSIVPHDLMWLIARGAAVHHRDLLTLPSESIKPKLGAGLYLEVNENGQIRPRLLIPHYKEIPCEHTERFKINPALPILTVQLLTESETDRRNVPLERREITIKEKDINEIKVKVKVDESRLIHFSVIDPTTGIALDDNIEIRGDRLITPEQIRRVRDEYAFTGSFWFGQPAEQQSVAVGIDLGTTTCEAVVWNGANGGFERGIESELHSKVLVEPDPWRVTIENMDKNPDDEGYFENFKADIGMKQVQNSHYSAFGKYWPPDILSAHIISKIWRELQRKYGSKKALNQAVITVPSDFTQDQCAMVSNAAKIAGIEFPTLLTEPVSAFIAYTEEYPGLKDTDGNYLVFDFGGGTTDVCIIRTRESALPEIVASSGDNRVGGKDITAIFAEKIIERFEKNNDLTVPEKDRGVVYRRAYKLADDEKVKISAKQQFHFMED